METAIAVLDKFDYQIIMDKLICIILPPGRQFILFVFKAMSMHRFKP